MAILPLFLYNSCQEIEESPTVSEEISNQKSKSQNQFEMEEILEPISNFRLGDWNMIYEETFEGNEPFYAYITKQFPAAHSFKTSTSPFFKGSKSGRFELRDSDVSLTPSGGQRVEILVRKEILSEITNNEAWYSFALFPPSNGFSSDNLEDIITQWHNGGTPTLSIRARNNQFYFRIGNNSQIKTSEWPNYNLGSVNQNAWSEFVIHIIHSDGTNGLVEVWRNGIKLFKHSGPNMYLGSSFPVWKLGIYKPGWENNFSNSSVRILYFDNIRLANRNSNLLEMSPSTDNLKGWGPYIPSIKSFTLINTITNQEYGKVPNNGIINIKPLKDNRITLRANFEEPFEGSLNFNLTGGRSMSYTDNTLPFTLYGETSTGQYVNAGGTPIGSYTLNALPFADKNKTGKEGQLVNFKFKVESNDGIGVIQGYDNTNLDLENNLNISSFSLINASNNSVIQTLTNGSQLLLSQLGNVNLNFRANSNSMPLGSVFISLSGPINSSRTDNGSTFDLLNNSGLLLPAGNYTLTAIPYSLLDRGGNVGTHLTISFSVIDSNSDNTDSNLIGYWKLDEGNGKVLIDHSGNGNNAVLQNTSGVNWNVGVKGLGINLPGTIDRFGSIPHSQILNISGPLTISSWIKPNGVGTRMILSKGGPDGYELGTFNSGHLEFRINRESSSTTFLQSKQKYPTNGTTWMHVAVTYDGNKAVMYINGIQDNVVEFGNVAIKNNTSPLYIGARSGSNRWSGTLDELRLYKRVLNSSEILNLVK